MAITMNKRYPRLEPAYQLWLLNDEGGWNKEDLDLSTLPGDGIGDKLYGVLAQHNHVMPRCPAKIMRISEVFGS